jgi:hypothetical protein
VACGCPQPIAAKQPNLHRYALLLCTELRG